jgi:hypothetical protein
MGPDHLIVTRAATPTASITTSPPAARSARDMRRTPTRRARWTCHRRDRRRCSRMKGSKSSSSRSLIAWQLTSAPLGDPRSNEAEEHTSNDDGDGESDESEPKPLKVRHSRNPHSVADVPRLLDDLIRPQQQRRRDREAEGLGGLEVDDEFEFGRLLDWRSTGFVPLRVLST